MPENAIYVGRPTRWGNPYPVTKHMPEETATHELMMSLDSYRTWLIGKLRDEPHFLEPLRGKNLACWCPLLRKDGKPVPCHTDILLELANK